MRGRRRRGGSRRRSKVLGRGPFYSNEAILCYKNEISFAVPSRLHMSSASESVASIRIASVVVRIGR